MTQSRGLFLFLAVLFVAWHFAIADGIAYVRSIPAEMFQPAEVEQ